ncbi:Gfo/Idh/MocA family oxidoreductase [Candidatus Kaiserbacteria bacterium]|nr:Gfo/Idh/MocA family oxidoreductase [Candidatus Kaiserbacteria bacterium]
MNSGVLKVGIIGAGKIGASFDSPNDEMVISHAHGYYNHDGFEIVGFVDTQFDQAELAAEKWGGKAYRTISDLFANEEVDVVSVCSLTESHYDILKELESHDQLVGGIIEKPLASTIEEAREIKDSDFYKDRSFLINYKRRFLPEYKEIKKLISSGDLGSFLNGTVYYGKGLQHNAVHALDLLSYLGLSFDNVDYVKSKKSYDSFVDYEAVLSNETGGNIHLVSISAKYYKVFEQDLFFEKGRIKFGDEGCPVVQFDIAEDVLFEGYMSPVEKRVLESNADKVMNYVVDSLYNSINKSRQLECSIDDGFETQISVSNILKVS